MNRNLFVVVFFNDLAGMLTVGSVDRDKPFPNRLFVCLMWVAFLGIIISTPMLFSAIFDSDTLGAILAGHLVLWFTLGLWAGADDNKSIW